MDRVGCAGRLGGAAWLPSSELSSPPWSAPSWPWESTSWLGSDARAEARGALVGFRVAGTVGVLEQACQALPRPGLHTDQIGASAPLSGRPRYHRRSYRLRLLTPPLSPSLSSIAGWLGGKENLMGRPRKPRRLKRKPSDRSFASRLKTPSERSTTPKRAWRGAGGNSKRATVNWQRRWSSRRPRRRSFA